MARYDKKYYDILGVSETATQREIKKAFHKLALKKAPDKIQEKFKRWATAAETEEFQKILQAYKILIGEESLPNSGGGGGGPTPNQPRFDNCDYCQQRYDFDKERYPYFKEFRKRNGESESFHFCSKRGAECYKEFVLCYVCENGRTKLNRDNWRRKRGTDIFFCSDDCHKKYKQGDFPEQNGGPNSPPKWCCKCHKVISNGEESFSVAGGLSICKACATKKCVECGKEGLPLEGSGWVGYHNAGWFCCEEHYQNWKNKNDNQNQDGKREEDIFRPIINDQKKGKRKPGQKGKDQKNDNSPSNSNGNSNKPNQNDNQNDNTKNNSNLPENIQAIAKLPLAEAKQKAEKEISKMLTDNHISEQELEKENWLGQKNWKDYLKKLDTPQKVAEFTNKMRQAILKASISKQKSNSTTGDKKPKNRWIFPTIIIVIIFIAALTLLIIIKKRKQRGF